MYGNTSKYLKTMLGQGTREDEARLLPKDASGGSTTTCANQ